MSPGLKNSHPAPGPGRPAGRSSRLWSRDGIIRSIRGFFHGRHYLEVETPNLIPSPAPEIHIDAVPADGGYLHTSPELCMKRLLSAGYSRIFQISKCYRQGERGDRHLPEFTLLEWYRAGVDYRSLMGECEELVRFVARDRKKEGGFEYRGKDIPMEGPFKRIPVTEAFRLYSSLSMEEALASNRFDEIMVREIEPRLNSPTFLYDFPAALASLARVKKGDPGLAERFELYMGGLELANAFTELTDSREQERRFRRDRDARRKLGKDVYPFPRKFIQDLAGMPGSAGIAFGVDRLVMLFTDSALIDDVVSFTPEEL